MAKKITIFDKLLIVKETTLNWASNLYLELIN